MMTIFLYTFFVVLGALVVIMGVGGVLTGYGETEHKKEIEGEATAAMCTTNLLEMSGDFSRGKMDDFVIEQDMVYTYDSFNL